MTTARQERHARAAEAASKRKALAMADPSRVVVVDGKRRWRTEITQPWVVNWTMGWIHFWEEFFPNDHTPFTARKFPG